MAARIESVSINKNPVSAGESFIVSVAIVTQGYLKQSRHAELAGVTNGQLRLRGESVPTNGQLCAYRHSALHIMTHQQMATMEVENGYQGIVSGSKRKPAIEHGRP